MNNMPRNFGHLFLAASLFAVVTTVPSLGSEPGTVGLIRVSDSHGTNFNTVTDACASDCGSCGCVSPKPTCHTDTCRSCIDCENVGCRARDWWNNQRNLFDTRNRAQSDSLIGLLDRWGPPIGFYKITYAADPHDYDQRDARVFASPITGVPMVVPLAPNVNYTMNYGRGIPASRLTPISRIAP